MHLASVGVFHRGHNEAGSAQGDLAFGPAVHRQRQLPFPNIVHPRKLHALRTAHAAGFTCRQNDRSWVNRLLMALLFPALEDFVNQPGLAQTERVTGSRGYVSDGGYRSPRSARLQLICWPRPQDDEGRNQISFLCNVLQLQHLEPPCCSTSFSPLYIKLISLYRREGQTQPLLFMVINSFYLTLVVKCCNQYINTFLTS